jgi:hypothetical protein
MEHHISQNQPDLMILKAPKHEMKKPLFDVFENPMFSFIVKVPLKSSNLAEFDLCDAPYH